MSHINFDFHNDNFSEFIKLFDHMNSIWFFNDVLSAMSTFNPGSSMPSIIIIIIIHCRVNMEWVLRSFAGCRSMVPPASLLTPLNPLSLFPTISAKLNCDMQVDTDTDNEFMWNWSRQNRSHLISILPMFTHTHTHTSARTWLTDQAKKVDTASLCQFVRMTSYVTTSNAS